jgi:hypothetical protein
MSLERSWEMTRTAYGPWSADKVKETWFLLPPGVSLSPFSFFLQTLLNRIGKRNPIIRDIGSISVHLPELDSNEKEAIPTPAKSTKRLQKGKQSFASHY